jgi:hypothetical protein
MPTRAGGAPRGTHGARGRDDDAEGSGRAGRAAPPARGNARSNAPGRPPKLTLEGKPKAVWARATREFHARAPRVHLMRNPHRVFAHDRARVLIFTEASAYEQTKVLLDQKTVKDI